MMARKRPENDRTPVYQETIKRFWVLRLGIEVRQDGVYVRLRPIQRSFRHIPFNDINDVRVATYSSAAYGGWHWGVRRTLDGNTVYRLRGDRGVELVLTDGTRIFLGTERPTALKTAIMQTRESPVTQG